MKEHEQTVRDFYIWVEKERKRRYRRQAAIQLLIPLTAVVAMVGVMLLVDWLV